MVRACGTVFRMRLGLVHLLVLAVARIAQAEDKRKHRATVSEREVKETARDVFTRWQLEAA